MSLPPWSWRHWCTVRDSVTMRGEAGSVNDLSVADGAARHSGRLRLSTRASSPHGSSALTPLRPGTPGSSASGRTSVFGGLRLDAGTGRCVNDDNSRRVAALTSSSLLVPVDQNHYPRLSPELRLLTSFSLWAYCPGAGEFVAPPAFGELRLLLRGVPG